MKRYITILTVGWLITAGTCVAQTNTFPSSGNVGIGTTSPSQDLFVVGNSIIGSNNLDSVLGGEGNFQSNNPLAATSELFS